MAGGSDQIFEDEDAGEDTITFNGNEIVGIDAVLTAIQFHLYDDGLFVTDSTNDTTYAGTAIENLVGGLGDDRFLFHDSGAVTGSGGWRRGNGYAGLQRPRGRSAMYT